MFKVRMWSCFEGSAVVAEVTMLATSVALNAAHTPVLDVFSEMAYYEIEHYAISFIN